MTNSTNEQNKDINNVYGKQAEYHEEKISTESLAMVMENKDKYISNYRKSIDNIMELEESRFYRYDKGEIKSVNTGIFVDELINKNKGFVLNEEFYIYRNGYYKKMTKFEIKGLIQDNLDPVIRTTAVINDIYRMWQFHSSMLVQERDVNNKPYLINLINGIYNLETKTFTEGHTPTELITIRINTEYKIDLNKEEHGKEWHKFLDFALPDLEIQAVLQEIMGYSLTQYVNAKKFFVFNGVGNSGKSKIIELLTELVGLDNTSNVALQELNGFNTSELYQKTLNVYADLPTKPITSDNDIKILTGEDLVFGDRKHMSPIKFYVKSKMLFSTNGMPENFGDKSPAFYKRLMIIPFKYAKGDKELDTKLMEKFIREKDYIFMWALRGLIRLYNNNFQFTYSLAIENEISEYKIHSNPLHQFVSEECTLENGESIITTKFVEEFHNYCISVLGIERKNCIGRNKVLKMLETDFGCHYGDKIKEKGKRIIRGIKLKN
ncbi:phage/plasmid primase, P4 family, C-terminal domain-containing protein [Psychrobacillus sp. OK028]|uniref:DNA primase family protein n=1 Tax=Psychrobacillus sp. OK028 TaxID=1884359 RepID=UPI00088BCFB2|nr:DNA primase family protein [Psychrobacillus sp. OK028]SDO02764.1 phage/plasmid primase, P4 family, C-terminal domain-containing protein [Psychrobacillus sp. OK028]